MTEVSKVNGTTQTMYSNDKVFHEGMELKDAYSDKTLFEKFKQADVNGDGKISAEEINRYNGPVLYGQFYPGLKLDNVSKNNISTFREIDFNKDGVIENDEIGLKTEKDKMIQKANQKRNLSGLITGLSGAAGLASSLIGVMAMVFAGAIFAPALIITATGGAVAAGAFYVDNRIQKNIDKNTQKELTKLDNEYKNKKTATQIQVSSQKVEDTAINKYIKLFTANDSDGGEEITEQEAKMLKALAS